MNEKEYVDQLRALYTRYFKDREEYIDKLYEAEHDYLEKLKDLYDSALSAVDDLLQEQIDDLDELEEKEKKVYEDEQKNISKKIKSLEKVNKNLDKEIKALEKEQKLIQKNSIDPLDDRIKAQEEIKKNLEDELSIMQKQNEQREDAINLQKAAWELEKARNQRTSLVYTDDDGEGGQLRYRPDEQNLRQQRQNYDDLQYQMVIKQKEEEINKVQEVIDDLEEEKSKYEDQISEIQKKIDLINEQKDANSEIIDDLNEQNDALQEQIDLIEEEYSKLKTNVEEYRDKWKEISELTEKAAKYALLSSIGFDPEKIKELDLESLEAFKTIYNAIEGSLNANDEGMTKALQDLTGSSLGDYLTSTAEGIAELNKLDLSSVSAAIQSAGQGALAMNDGFALSASILSGVVQNLDNVAKSAENATSVIGSAISTENSSGTGENGQPTLASSIAIVGETSEEALGDKDGVQNDLAGVTEAADTATRGIGEIQNALEDLTNGSPYEIEIRVKKTGDEISAHAKGTVGNAYADGYPGLPTSELALRSEYGQPELTVYPNGSYELTNSPTLSHLPKDTVIFNEEQTKRILKNGGLSGKAYASGNATAKTLAEVMPDKAAIFERFEANLTANIDAIKTNTFDISRNVADMAKSVVNNTTTQGGSFTLNGGINITCPGVTEAEVARNMGPLVEQAFTNIFSGMSLGANQRAMRR